MYRGTCTALQKLLTALHSAQTEGHKQDSTTLGEIFFYTIRQLPIRDSDSTKAEQSEEKHCAGA